MCPGSSGESAGTVASFELVLTSDETLVATVRRFVGELCVRVLIDPDVTSRVVIATHELLDNAVRHAAGDASGIRVELARFGEEVGVVIVTRNRIDEVHGRVLQGVLDEMHTSADRETFYRDLLGRVARMDGSGLGLARVFAEAGMNVSSRREEDVVILRAEGWFLPGPVPR
ncbi:MAG: hypothetical protein K0S65_1715 [Labilithrix sp.]|nr:hypothetical protein [Labilithrix sp.]